MNDVLEVGGGDFEGRYVSGEDLVCEIFEGQVLPLRGPVIREGRNLFWDEKTTIRGKAFEYDFFKRELWWSVSATFIA